MNLRWVIGSVRCRLRTRAAIRRHTIRTLDDRRFWLGLFSSLGQIGDEVDRDVYPRVLGISDDEGLAWWDRLTGSYEGVMDDSDGAVADPAILLSESPGSRSSRVEIHPGDIYFFFRDGAHEFMVGNIGPHWSLPFLRLREVAALSQTAIVPPGVPAASWHARVFLCLLAGVWLTTDEELAEGRTLFIESFIRAGLGDADQAAAFADAWTQSVRAFDHPWRNDPDYGWVSSAHWSERYPPTHPDAARAVNAFLKAS